MNCGASKIPSLEKQSVIIFSNFFDPIQHNPPNFTGFSQHLPLLSLQWPPAEALLLHFKFSPKASSMPSSPTFSALWPAASISARLWSQILAYRFSTVSTLLSSFASHDHIKHCKRNRLVILMWIHSYTVLPLPREATGEEADQLLRKLPPATYLIRESPYENDMRLLRGVIAWRKCCLDEAKLKQAARNRIPTAIFVDGLTAGSTIDEEREDEEEERVQKKARGAGRGRKRKTSSNPGGSSGASLAGSSPGRSCTQKHRLILVQEHVRRFNCMGTN